MKLPKGYIDEQGRYMGLHLDLPEAEYHAVKAFSYSFSKQFLRSPAHGLAYTRKTWEPDPDRELFKAVHLLCLEPEKQNRLVVKDGVWRDKLKAEVIELQKSGNIVLKQKDYDEAKIISQKIKDHPIAGAVLSNSICEASIFWLQPVYDDGGEQIGEVYCKGRIDVLSVLSAGICLGDLKNSGDLSKDALIHSLIAKNLYHHQQAFYGEGIKSIFGSYPIKRYWFFVETSDPWGIKIKNCTEAMIDRAMVDINFMLRQYMECLVSDVWPCYAEEETDADLPEHAWAVVE